MQTCCTLQLTEENKAATVATAIYLNGANVQLCVRLNSFPRDFTLQIKGVWNVKTNMPASSLKMTSSR